MRSRYWSNTELADKIRGIKKPKALEWDEWAKWEAEAKKAHPIRFWIADVGLDKAQIVLQWPYEALRDFNYWYCNRFVTRTHALTSSSLKKGKWHEFETRLLHCAFDELVNFVEIESAWMNVICDKEAAKKFKKPSWWNRRKWRCPEAGVDHLNWAAGLVMDESWGIEKTDPLYGSPTGQAESARETLALYNWWKVTRPARPDPYDASGWTDICEKKIEDEDVKRKSLNILNLLEETYHTEDGDMLCRLVKIRSHLWT